MKHTVIPPDRVGVVFVNYHSEGLIQGRASQLLSAGHPVVIADNSGTYRGPGMVIQMHENAGFARAANRAVASLDDGVDIICLHNPDVEAPPNALADLSAALMHQPRPGIAAPAEQSGRLLRRRGYHYPTVLREALLAALPHGLIELSPGHAGTRQGATNQRLPSRVLTIPGAGRRYAAGSLVLVHRGAWTRLNGFDERYFLYGEDLDFWHRLGSYGYSTSFHSDIVIGHHFSASSPMSLARRQLARWLSVQLFFETFEPRSWRAVRSIHKRFLWRQRRECPRLTALIATLWDEGRPPSDVMSNAFARLADGRFS